ncbi:MAG: DMT family transporter [Bacteroidales bacterium]|nr:DMT family transporter [Bacteroidales bacterium]
MIQRKESIIGAIAVSLAAILWGLDGVVLTPRLYSLDVPFVVFVFHALPFLMMNVVFYKQYRFVVKFTSQDVLLFALVATFGGAIGTLAIVKALFLVNFEKLTIVILLQKLQPVFSIFLAWILLKERLDKRFAFWALVAILSGYTLTFGFCLPKPLNAGSNITEASLYAVLAAFSFGSSTVFSKMLLRKFSFSTTSFFRYGFTSLIMLGVVLYTGTIANVLVTERQHWLIFLLIAITTGSGAIFLYYFGLNKIKASIATICELFFPLSAILFDYWINKSFLTPVQWISAIVLIGAIIKLNLRRK